MPDLYAGPPTPGQVIRPPLFMHNTLLLQVDVAGAKLTREVFFNLWKYSSLVPGNGARKLAAAFDGRVVNVGADSPCAWWITSPLGTPRGRYDEYSS
jgi:hypothetical protein